MGEIDQPDIISIIRDIGDFHRSPEIASTDGRELHFKTTCQVDRRADRESVESLHPASKMIVSKLSQSLKHDGEMVSIDEGRQID
jgi:hypothetical protein